MPMIEFNVYKADDEWHIGAEVGHEVFSGESAADLDAKLEEWGMKRAQLTTFESEDLRQEFETAFGPIADAASAEPGLD